MATQDWYKNAEATYRVSYRNKNTGKTVHIQKENNGWRLVRPDGNIADYRDKGMAIKSMNAYMRSH